MEKRNIRAKLEKYFDFKNDKATCKLCSHSLKCDRTFNLRTHVMKVHKVKGEEFRKKENSLLHLRAKSLLENKTKKDVIKIELSKKQLFRSYIGLVTEDNIPFDILNSENFKNIIDPICRGLGVKFKTNFDLNSNNCKHVLKIVADNIREAIKTELDLKQRLLSLRIDSATCLSPNVFGISAQFIKCNEIQSRILGLIQLKDEGASPSKNLATEIINTITKYDINLNQIVSITSDNGPNMIKTANTLSKCGIYEDHLYEGDDGNDKYLKDIQTFEDSSEIHSGEIQICRCAAHVAQLCALDLTRDTVIKSLLWNCRNLMKFIKKPSNGYRETFELQSLTVPELDSPTKWGSTYNMMTSLRNSKDVLIEIKPIKNETFDENFVLNKSFWDFVEAYCIALEPLQHTIVKFQQEQLHYGDFYAEWLKCKICTGKLLEIHDQIYIEKIAQNLLHSMETRTINLLNNENLLSCLYLDPRFNHTLTQQQRLKAATYLKKLYESLKIINNNIVQRNTTKSSPVSLESSRFAQKADEYLNEYLTRNFVPTSNAKIDVLTRIENLQLPFLRADVNVLHFWRDKQYSDPELYALSNICYAVPSTQVTIERAFSSLKPILAENRNRINQETLENILLVKLSAGYLDQAIEDLPLFEETT